MEEIPQNRSNKNFYRPRWPSLNSELSKTDQLKRIADRDSLIFTLPRNTLVFVTWCTITSAGFGCLLSQRNHELVTFGLSFMALVAVIMGIRLFLSVHEHLNALFNDPFGDETRIGTRAAVVMLGVVVSFSAYGLAFVVSSAVIQTSKSCWVMPESMFESLPPDF
ncbi:hypothetical protein [Agrobacterium radiobacter]|uniref:hypothetical protein n=1 Tax=Agrobacterium radiobacter TaxID=362 RepID=UPI000370B188|nr:MULTISPECIES: hypothetical protein [Agrobacterium tumefaciens complex]EPR18589.1 hypothetical protein L902_03440 [Agrobacterium radiobacter DSM 30147]KAB0455384.1 phage tail protein [Agrobacterium tumefaciens]KWT78868.1 hypothetical protein ASH09_23890 [Agrobacterium radiobacter]NIB12754.1 phage tail protein [Agrobacterium radiobacter]OOO40920.1 hypothetical protein BS628_00425 [Agrobacterium radiobacter]